MKNDDLGKVPSIRFKGFTNDWELRKLIDIVNRVNKSSNSNELPKVEFEDIVSGEGRLNKDVFLKLDDRKGISFEPENILYGKLRPYLKNWLFPNFSGIALGDFWVFKATNISVPSFDFYLIQSDNYQKVANDTSGTKMPRSDWKNVSSTDFAIPGKQEQQQIGIFFQSFDNLITLHQRKLDKTKELKKTMLSKMFPKNGEDKPEFRFSGFTDAWEQCDFKDLAKVRRGLTYKPKDIQKKGVRVLRSSNINEDTFELRSDDIFVNQSALNIKSVDENDILITSANGSSRLVGKHALIKNITDLAVHGGFMLLATSEEPYFTNAFMSSSWYSRFIHIYVSGGNGAIGNLSKSDLDSQKIYIPKQFEQQQIGTFFQSLDNLITLHQRELEQLKNIKKTLLKHMFV